MLATPFPESYAMAEEPLDLYADGVQFQISPFSVIMAFTLAPVGQSGTTPAVRVVTVRTSLEHAKAMAIILRKQLKNYEDGSGSHIPLHPNVWQSLGLSKQEDW